MASSTTNFAENNDAEKRNQDYFSKHVQDKIIHFYQEHEKLENAQEKLKENPMQMLWALICTFCILNDIIHIET